MGFHVYLVGALLLLRAALDDDSVLAWSLHLNQLTQYLHDDKNNMLSIYIYIYIFISYTFIYHSLIIPNMHFHMQ